MKLVILLFISLTGLQGYAQQKYNVMFYNVENFFDTVDNPSTADEDFLPTGNRNWNNYRMYDKSNKVGKVILNAGGMNLPVLIGLAEVESDTIGQMLTKHSPIKYLGYDYLHQESQDRRGIDVMLLYKKDTYHPISTHFYPVEYTADSTFKSRDILYSKGVINKDTLHIFVNHWPSKYGGAVATVPLRKAAAQTLKKRTDSIMTLNPNAKIIIMGDFNDAANEPSLTETLNVKSYNEATNTDLINLTLSIENTKIGSYKYQGRWNTIDHIIVSRALVNTHEGLTTSATGMKIINLPFLLEDDDKYTGQRPNRTYIGYTYHNGYSDHLPVILELSQQ